jgi:hypothetical protein
MIAATQAWPRPGPGDLAAIGPGMTGQQTGGRLGGRFRSWLPMQNCRISAALLPGLLCPAARSWIGATAQEPVPQDGQPCGQ